MTGGVPPLLPARKPFRCFGLRGDWFCKYFQIKGLRPNSSSQRGYGHFSFLNGINPGFGRGFLGAVFIIWDWTGGIRQLDVVCFLVVEGFWGLTCDFGWKNVKNIFLGRSLGWI
jgi:hypothetical protein